MPGAQDLISAVRAKHVEAVNSTDVDRLLSGMTDDVVYLAPDLPPIRGKTAVRTFVAPIYERSAINISMVAESLDVSGSRAVEWGHVHGTLAMDGGAAQPISLKYLFVYRLESDGSWRISHDISNQAAATT